MDTQHIKHSKFGPFSAEGGGGGVSGLYTGRKKSIGKFEKIVSHFDNKNLQLYL